VAVAIGVCLFSSLFFFGIIIASNAKNQNRDSRARFEKEWSLSVGLPRARAPRASTYATGATFSTLFVSIGQCLHLSGWSATDIAQAQTGEFSRRV
jgi:hypothetical protein